MAEWANLKRFVRRVSEIAMIDEDDAGKRVQGLLSKGELKARSPSMAIIPPPYWAEISVDWSKLDDSEAALGRDEYGRIDGSYDEEREILYEFFVDGKTYYASYVEIPAAEARAFLHRLDYEDLPPVLPQATNRNPGGRRTTINWGGLAGHIAAWTIENGIPETQTPIIKEAEKFFAQQKRRPSDDRDLRHFASEFLKHYSTTTKHPRDG